MKRRHGNRCRRIPAGEGLFALLLVCAGATAAGAGVAGGRLVDLTHAFDEETVFWPTARTFHLERGRAGVTEGGWYYEANEFCTAEHGGTHIDAPIHFFAERDTVDEIPLERLIGEAVLVDVSSKASGNADYQVAVEDFRAWESSHGRIPDGAIVLLRTGFGEAWPDRERYLGTDERGPGGVPKLHFPGLSTSGARWLVSERKVAAVGLDTASIDFGQSKKFETHVFLFEHDVPAFENLANLSELPPRGFMVIALPMKIRGGSGGPLRAVAVVPEKPRKP